MKMLNEAELSWIITYPVGCVQMLSAGVEQVRILVVIRTIFG